MDTRYAVLLLAVMLSACGGGGETQTAPVAPTPPVAADPWEDVVAALEAHAVDDLSLVVGDATGERFRFEKGAFRITDERAIASASKWLTGATIVTLVEQGLMSLDDRPQDYLSYWTSDPGDWRSRITLEQLLSFTAGFHRPPGEAGCIGNEAYTMQSCVAEWYEIGVDAEPGTTYYYGPVHMQVAAAMAEIATGQPWREVVELTVALPLGLASTRFEGNNPRAAGAAISSAIDYAAFLQAQLAGELLPAGFDDLAAERLSGLQIVSRPAAIDGNNVDWYYGLGVWRECSEPIWSAECEAQTRVSSPGAFGWYPWLDLDNGYYAVLAMEEAVTLLSSPASDSVELGITLQPMIIAALRQTTN